MSLVGLRSLAQEVGELLVGDDIVALVVPEVRSEVRVGLAQSGNGGLDRVPRVRVCPRELVYTSSIPARVSSFFITGEATIPCLLYTSDAADE